MLLIFTKRLQFGFCYHYYYFFIINIFIHKVFLKFIKLSFILLIFNYKLLLLDNGLYI